MADSVHIRTDVAREGSSIGSAYLAIERSLKRFIVRLGTNAADVDDIAQEALVSAMKAENDRAIENPKAYLYRAARNLAVRTRSRRSRDIIAYIDEAEIAELPSAAPSAEDNVINRQRLATFCDALDALPPACRRAFELRTVYGYSHQEIADRLGISPRTVEKHLATGFERCMAYMRGRDSETPQEREPQAKPARAAARTR